MSAFEAVDEAAVMQQGSGNDQLKIAPAQIRCFPTLDVAVQDARNRNCCPAGVSEVMIGGIALLVAGIPSFKQVLDFFKHSCQESCARVREMRGKRFYDEIRGFIGLDVHINHAACSLCSRVLT